MEKVLCVCQGGNSRSVALAYYLKSKGKQAIAVGTDHTSKETFELLINWADAVIVTDKNLLHLVPYDGHKLRVWDVGHDRFFRGFSQELIDLYDSYYREQRSC